MLAVYMLGKVHKPLSTQHSINHIKEKEVKLFIIYIKKGEVFK